MIYRTGMGFQLIATEVFVFLDASWNHGTLRGGEVCSCLKLGDFPTTSQNGNGNKKAWCRICSQGIGVSAFRFDITMSSCNLW